MHPDGRIVLTYNDIRDARQAFAVLQANGPPGSWIQPYSPRDLAAHVGDGTQSSVFEGQVLVQVFYNQNAHLPAGPALGALGEKLARFGEVKAIHSLPSNQGNLREFRVEFFNLRSGAALIDSTNQQAQQLRNVSGSQLKSRSYLLP